MNKIEHIHYMLIFLALERLAFKDDLEYHLRRSLSRYLSLLVAYLINPQFQPGVILG